MMISYLLAQFMDRHALQSKARDDSTKVDSRETRSATNLHKHAGGRILRLESGLCKASAEIRLVAYRTSKPKQSAILAQKPTPKPNKGD